MKTQMSSFDIAAVVSELQSAVGLKVEKVFFPSHHELFFRLRGKREKKTVFIRIGQALWLEDGFRQADSSPPTFAMLLRKHLSGLKVISVSQHGFDRIVIFEFGSNVRLVVEIFGTGNVTLVEGDKIIQPLTSRSWKARDVKAGKEFKFPPESQNPFELDTNALAQIFMTSDKDLVRCLAVEVNLGGAHAEEVCKVIGIDKNEPADSMGLSEVNRILEIIALFAETMGQPSPYVVLEKGQPTDVQPFWLSLYSEEETTEFDTFSQAAVEYFSNLPERTPDVKVPGEGEITRLERQIERQKSSIEMLDTEAVEYQAMGDKLYANFQKFETVLEKAITMLSNGDWQAAEKDIEAMENVEDFEPATGIIGLKIDSDLFELDVRLSLNENAAALYDRSKKAKQKKKGALEALEDSKALLKKARSSEEKAEAKHRTKKAPTKMFWFDKFRWFVSSEGNMVLGGRDARTNDQVVKKHLKQTDLYAHADVHGAPSVVIKEGSQASEKTLTEACLFALCFSKAWKSKVASGSAYWVKPDQVSKSPEPGEFIPRGSFVIRGKRNYTKKLEMKVAVGEVTVEGERKIMCGPESALAAQTEKFFLITPGEEKRTLFVKKLSDFYNISIEEIDRILPTGDLKVLAKP
jgi:predicted ribosome quality control (RQC) complex YloA/Tae2 family protein